MKVIPRNHTKKIRNILEAVTEYVAYNHRNNYEGREFKEPLADYDIRVVMDDLMEKQASIFYNAVTDEYTVQFAGRCKWVLRIR